MTADIREQFADRIAIVTGGTQGLGEAVAALFVERGARGVVVCGRNAERGEAVARKLGKPGQDVRFVAADLTRLEDARKLVGETDHAFGRVDVLVNAAASTERGTILDTSPELFDAIFAVNLRAPFFLIQDVARIMRREKRPGAIVNIQSMSAHGGQPFICAYSVSKGALATLTRNAAYSLMPDRIRVNGLNIGWMDTPGEHAIQRKYHTDDPDWLVEAERSQPFGRLLKPAEVARTVAYLASDESGLMTGSIIDFDQQVRGAYDAPAHPGARLPDA